MRVFVTGAAGFFGAHLVRNLAGRAGASVLATDLAPAVDHAVAVAWAPTASSIRYRSLDVGNGADVASLLAEFQPDAVVHAAALTPTAAQEASEPQRIRDVNIGGTMTVLHAASRLPSRPRTLFISSAAVLGPSHRDGLVAEDATVDPRTLYAQSKVECEAIAAGLGVTSVRLCAVYGELEQTRPTRPTTSPIHLVATAGRSFGVAGPDVVRDWVHGDDAAAAIASLLQTERLKHPLYHVGGGEPVGWHRLIAAFRAAGVAVHDADPALADLVMHPAEARSVLAIDRITRATGWRPRSIEQGIADLMRALGR